MSLENWKTSEVLKDHNAFIINDQFFNDNLEIVSWNPIGERVIDNPNISELCSNTWRTKIHIVYDALAMEAMDKNRIPAINNCLQAGPALQ